MTTVLSESGSDLTALVVGQSPATPKESFVYAATRASTRLVFARGHEDALRWLDTPSASPSCIFVAHPQDLEPLSRWVRDRAHFFVVSIVAMVTHPSDNTFRAAYAGGADDALMHGDLGGITRRLANMESLPRNYERPPANQGLAVIAFPDIARRRVVGRTLRQAGFDVAYAVSTDELQAMATSTTAPTLIVTHPGFPPHGGRAAMELSRQLFDKPRLPGLIMPASDEEADRAQADTDTEQAGRLLFFAEEAMRADARDLRASPRYLHYGMCAFREAGSLFPTFGLTHNISQQGLYVRTLDPPRPGSDLWFEMRAPQLDVTIHLRGTVVWRREPSTMGGTAPPGFGMRVEAEACPKGDLAYYERGYQQLQHTQPCEMSFPPAPKGASAQ